MSTIYGAGTSLYSKIVPFQSRKPPGKICQDTMRMLFPTINPYTAKRSINTKGILSEISLLAVDFDPRLMRIDSGLSPQEYSYAWILKNFRRIFSHKSEAILREVDSEFLTFIFLCYFKTLASVSDSPEIAIKLARSLSPNQTGIDVDDVYKEICKNQDFLAGEASKINSILNLPGNRSGVAGTEIVNPFEIEKRQWGNDHAWHYPTVANFFASHCINRLIPNNYKKPIINIFYCYIFSSLICEPAKSIDEFRRPKRKKTRRSIFKMMTSY